MDNKCVVPQATINVAKSVNNQGKGKSLRCIKKYTNKARYSRIIRFKISYAIADKIENGAVVFRSKSITRANTNAKIFNSETSTYVGLCNTARTFINGVEAIKTRSTRVAFYFIIDSSNGSQSKTGTPELFFLHHFFR